MCRRLKSAVRERQSPPPSPAKTLQSPAAEGDAAPSVQNAVSIKDVQQRIMTGFREKRDVNRMGTSRICCCQCAEKVLSAENLRRSRNIFSVARQICVRRHSRSFGEKNKAVFWKRFVAE